MINIGTIQNINRIKKFLRGAVVTGNATVSGDTGSALFVVLKGEVGVYVKYGQPGAEMVRTLGAGDLFADCGLLRDRPAANTTAALCDSLILPIELSSVVEFIQEEPALSFELLKELCLRLEQTRAAYEALIVQHDLQGRRRPEAETRPPRSDK